MDEVWVQGLPSASFRRLNLHSYDRGHSTLRLVAPANWYWEGTSAQEEKTVEIQFKDVAALALPESFATLDVAVGQPSDTDAMKNLFGPIKIGDRTTYRLRDTEGRIGYVIAGAVAWAEY